MGFATSGLSLDDIRITGYHGKSHIWLRSESDLKCRCRIWITSESHLKLIQIAEVGKSDMWIRSESDLKSRSEIHLKYIWKDLFFSDHMLADFYMIQICILASGRSAMQIWAKYDSNFLHCWGRLSAAERERALGRPQGMCLFVV